jgi:Holliday junction DNA helicase RuvA
MIGRVSGTLVEARPDRVLVETNGIGWDVQIPMSTFSVLPAPGKPVVLHIHTHVREDAIQLFGFFRTDEKVLFERLLNVSGIGPKVALGVLSGLPVPDFLGAVATKNISLLCTIPGVGKKLAERLALEMKDRISGIVPDGGKTPPAFSSNVERDAVEALTNLGYKPAQAESAVSSAARLAPDSPLPALLQAALRSLAK